MPRLEDPKEQILKTTRNKLHNKSYNSISYKEISEELNIKKSSLYHHFPSKEELGFTVLHQYRERINKLIEKAEEIYDNAIDKLDSYFRFFLHLREKGDLLCLAGVLTVEYNTLPKSIQEELAYTFEDHFTWLVQVIEEGRDQGSFSYSGTPRDKAAFIEATIQGGLILSRLLGDEHLKMVINELKSDLLINKGE